MNLPSTPSFPWMSRRLFLQTTAATAGGVTFALAQAAQAAIPALAPPRAKTALVKGAFVYPPTSTLDAAGYYSWPGSGFDAEGHQRDFTARLGQMAQRLGIQIEMDAVQIDDLAGADKFVEQAKAANADGIVLILLKKGHWDRVMKIADAVGVPTVVYAPLGVLLVDHIGPVRDRQGLYLVNSERFETIESGLKMLRARAWMKQSKIVNIDGQDEKSVTIPHLGTTIQQVPHSRFYEEFQNTPVDDTVRALAASYRNGATAVVEPNDTDITEAARCYVALSRLLQAEQADAMMMNCLPGLQHPHKHVPPCMAFMSLRDQGLPAGCQSDLNATLTLLLVQYLFDLPGFQQNASMDTEQNLYFGAHCTCPSRMNGPNAPAEPYILRSHAEAGWGCVPRVLFPKGTEATIAQYVNADAPQMYVYTGTIVDCPEPPQVGGCRTNLKMAINEVEDVRSVKGMHQIVFYGNHGRQLRTYCQLTGIEAVV